MKTARALIVDDEPDIRELLGITLGRMNITTIPADSLTQAKKQLKEHIFDLCLTDMKLPDGNGIDLVCYIQKNFPEIPVAILTAYGSMDTAVKALKSGAFDFVSKPIDLQRLRDLVNSALKLAETDGLEIQAQSQLIGESPAVKAMLNKILKMARSQAPVYICGESGCGKELAAKLIHEQGPRRDQPFVPVNCGAIPTELMESEFFGHQKGSFTGAHSDKIGLFQAANGGTLFLDEVADLPIAMQVKLLRALQEKSIRPVGSEQEIKVDVRILSATHKKLNDEVVKGHFRQDLFYRINVIELEIPPLRERGQDILLIAKSFLAKFSNEYDLPEASLTEQAEKMLLDYKFPGNIRELANILERAFTLCDNNIIDEEDLQLQHKNSIDLPLPASIPEGSINSLEEYLEGVEKEAIIKALDATKWNRTAAAKKLGMTFRQLRYRLKKLDIE